MSGGGPSGKVRFLLAIMVTSGHTIFCGGVFYDPLCSTHFCVDTFRFGPKAFGTEVVERS